MDYSFEYERPKPVIPKVNTSDKTIGWLGGIMPGMTKKQVLQMTQRLSAAKVKGNTITWTMPGPGSFRGSTKTAVWTARLMFKKDILTVLEVDVQ